MAYSWPRINQFSIPTLGIQPLVYAVSRAAEQIANSKPNKYRRLYSTYRETLKTPYIAPPFEPPKRAPLPNHFSVDEVQLGARTTRLISSTGNNSRATFILPIGHGTDAVHYQQTMNFFNSKGADSRVVELEVPQENTQFSDGATITEGYDDILSSGILDKNSAVWDKIPEHHKVFLMPHSSSGQSLERVMFSRPEKAAFALENFSHVYQTGTMLDTANSSHRHAPRLSVLYLKYASHPNVSPQIAGTTIVDKEWLLRNVGVDDCFFDDISTHATHGQASHLKLAGIKLFNDVAAAITKGENLKDFLAVPRTFIHGKIDESACPLTIKDYADLIGVRFKAYSKTGHNPGQNLRIDRAILNHAFNCVPARQSNRTQRPHAAADASPTNAPQAF